LIGYYESWRFERGVHFLFIILRRSGGIKGFDCSCEFPRARIIGSSNKIGIIVDKHPQLNGVEG